MRWRFLDSTNQAEADERNEIIARIDSWWCEFQAKTDDILARFSQKLNWELPEWMTQHLQGINPGLMWEFGPAVSGNGHRLVITPESDRYLRPLVRKILERAPALDGWEFYEYRLAEDLESAHASVAGRTGRDTTSFKVRITRGEGHRINLTYRSPAIFADDDDQSAFSAAFVATESILGEKCLDHWIGVIEIIPIPRPKGLKALFSFGANPQPHFVGLDRLNETVNALIGSIHEQLPPMPHYEWARDSNWTMWKLEPEEADDYCGQQDLFVGKSANPFQWQAARRNSAFTSESYSRCGETFCYVKVDRSQDFGEDGFADKGEIEDALDEVLIARQLGCCIGGGTGLRYFYIDLALTEIDEGIEMVRQRLQAGNVPNRSWIQFWDSDWEAEWVGVYDDSPPPPMPPHFA